MLHCPKRRNPIPPPQNPLCLRDIAQQSTQVVLDRDSFTADPISASQLDSLASVSRIMKHILASNHDLPNVFGAKVPMDTPLNITAWDSRLQDYHDENVVKFLRYGWPIN